MRPHPLVGLVTVLTACAGHGRRTEPSPAASEPLPFALELPADCHGGPKRGVDSYPGEWRCRDFTLYYDWGARNMVGAELTLPEGIAAESTWAEALGERPAQAAVYAAPGDVFGLTVVWPEADSVQMFDRALPAALRVWIEARSSRGRGRALAALRHIRWQARQ